PGRGDETTWGKPFFEWPHPRDQLARLGGSLSCECLKPVGVDFPRQGLCQFAKHKLARLRIERSDFDRQPGGKAAHYPGGPPREMGQGTSRGRDQFVPAVGQVVDQIKQLLLERGVWGEVVEVVDYQ